MGLELNDEEFKNAVEKHREEAAATLSFSPSIGVLVDQDQCTRISRLLRAAGGGHAWEKKIATSRLGESLPSARGLYMFVWRPALELSIASAGTERPAWILYVGKAGIDQGTADTIKSRYLSEYSKYVGGDPCGLWERTEPVTREERLSRYLTLRPLEYWFLVLDHARDIEIYERRLIKVFQPPLNKQHGPKMKPIATTAAF